MIAVLPPQLQKVCDFNSFRTLLTGCQLNPVYSLNVERRDGTTIE